MCFVETVVSIYPSIVGATNEQIPDTVLRTRVINAPLSQKVSIQIIDLAGAFFRNSCSHSPASSARGGGGSH